MGLSVIVNPGQCRGPGPLGTVVPWKNIQKDIYMYEAVGLTVVPV